MTMIRACTAEFLRWLSQHGIDPELPLIFGSMVMGFCMAVVYHEIQKKRVEHRHDKRKEL